MSAESFIHRFSANRFSTIAQSIFITQKIKLLAKIENTTKREAQKILATETGIGIRALERIRDLGDGAIELTVVLSASTKRKLDRLRGLRVHAQGAVTIAELIDQLCEIGLAKLDPLERAKRIERKTPTQTAPAQKQCVTRAKFRPYLHAVIRNQIWLRDLG